jgi:beta-carotene hydroxylase
MKEQLTVADRPIPRIEELGTDLLVTTAWQRRIALARPLIGVGVYIVATSLGLWWLTPIIVFLIFVAIVSVTHDVVRCGSLMQIASFIRDTVY